MSPRVSVIIPVYNGAKFVGKALDSVLGQTVPPDEVIVVDDGSTDGTPEVLARYEGRILNKRIPNSGASNARNTGMRLAKGELLAFLDHDDYWFKNYLQVNLEALERFPEAGMSCCDYVSRPAGLGGRMKKHFPTVRSLKKFKGPLMEDPFGYLIQECFIGTTSCVVMRAELVKKVGFFDEKYKICQDYDYWMRASFVTSFVVLRDVLMYKLVHDNNLSGNLIKMMLEHKKVQETTFAENKDWLRKKGLEPLCLYELARVNYYLGDLLFNAGQKKEFFRYLAAGLSYDKSLANYFEFSKSAGKKLLRLLTFDFVSRKTMEQALKKVRT